MIESSKQKNALFALHDLTVRARFMCYKGLPHQDIAVLLDMAEQLPRFLADEGDRTAEFRRVLVELAQRIPGCGTALQRFDEPFPEHGF